MGRGGKKRPLSPASPQGTRSGALNAVAVNKDVESVEKGVERAADMEAIEGYYRHIGRKALKLAAGSSFTHYEDNPYFPEEELSLYIAPMIDAHLNGHVISEGFFEDLFETIKGYLAEKNPGASGTDVQRASTQNNPGADFNIFINGEKGEGIQFKSEATANISKTSGRITKLLESSNGVGKINSQKDALDYTKEVLEHMNHYRHMYFLRVHKDPKTKRVLYKLHEVPCDILQNSIKNLQEEDFTALYNEDGTPVLSPKTKKPIQRTSAFLKNDQGEPFAKLVFDKSGNKVTLEQIDMSQCKTIAEWDIQADDRIFKEKD